MKSSLESLKEELARVSRLAYERGLVSARGGNVSARSKEDGLILITPSGVSLRDVAPEAIVSMSPGGEVVDSAGGFSPSKESRFHCAIYTLRPDVGAVVHVHPPHAVALSMRADELPIITGPAMVHLRRVPSVEFAPMGSRELAEMVREAFERDGELRALIMKQHGILTVAPDLMTAFYLSDLVEDTARVALLSGKT